MAKNKKNEKSQVSDKAAKDLYTMTAPSQKDANSKADESTVNSNRS